MSVRIVKCAKLGRELPGLPRPPFPGQLGQRVFENISQAAWQLWQQQSVIIINHYGLNMADKRAQQFLMEQLEEFFFGQDAAMPEGWIAEGETPPGQAPAKGAGKGAPVPQRK